MIRYDLVQVLKDSIKEEVSKIKDNKETRPYVQDVLFNFVGKISIILNEITDKIK